MHKACSTLLTKELFEPLAQVIYSRKCIGLKCRPRLESLYLGSPELQLLSVFI